MSAWSSFAGWRSSRSSTGAEPRPNQGGVGERSGGTSAPAASSSAARTSASPATTAALSLAAPNPSPPTAPARSTRLPESLTRKHLIRIPTPWHWMCIWYTDGSDDGRRSTAARRGLVAQALPAAGSGAGHCAGHVRPLPRLSSTGRRLGQRGPDRACSSLHRAVATCDHDRERVLSLGSRETGEVDARP
jgi:hypothetical protein